MYAFSHTAKIVIYMLNGIQMTIFVAAQLNDFNNILRQQLCDVE